MDVLEDGISGGVPVVTSVISIAVWGNGTIVYYDHWEDGYEEVLSEPTQPTTQIWGDNNPANGIPPGFATDVFTAGDVISLRNDVTVASPLTIDWDGRDKIGASRPVAVTRIAWDEDYGAVIVLDPISRLKTLWRPNKNI